MMRQYQPFSDKLFIGMLVLLVGFQFSCKKPLEINRLAPPIVEAVTPRYVANGEEITISGRNFGNMGTENIVQLNGRSISTRSAGPMLKLKLPDDFFSSSVLVSDLRVIMDGQSSEKMDKAFFSSQYPRIDSFTPSTVSVGETLNIYGENLTSGPATVQFFDSAGRSINASIIDSGTEFLKAAIPANAVSGNFQVIVVTGDPANRNAILDSGQTIRILK